MIPKVGSDPVVMGNDFAGKVLGVGGNVRKFRVGDEVYGMAPSKGAFAEYIVVPADCLSLKPSTLDFKQSAALPLVALTAIQALEKLQFKQTQSILVLGGATSTGMIALQWAKNIIGSTSVFTTCSAKSIPLCRALGADQTIDYSTQKWWEVLRGQNLDAIYDCVGGVDSWNNAKQVLKQNGSYVTNVGDGEPGIGGMLKLGLSVVNRKFWSNFSRPNYYVVLCSPNSRQLDALRQAVEEKKVRVVLDSVWALDDYVAVFKKSSEGRAKGKLIFDLDKKEKQEKQENQENQEKKENQENQEKKEDKKEQKGELETLV